MPSRSTSSALPEGISPEHHSGERSRSGRSATFLSFVILGGLLGAGLLGYFGGQPDPVVSRDFGPATLAVRAPAVLRNGLFFEMEISVRADAAMDEAVIGIDPALWRHVTVNTTIPTPAEESYTDGAFRLHYGPLEAGDRLLVKIDGQINPPMFAGTRGSISLLDGETPLGALPLSIRVLP